MENFTIIYKIQSRRAQNQTLYIAVAFRCRLPTQYMVERKTT